MHRSRFLISFLLAAASLLTLAICGLDFVAIRGVPAKLEPPANVSDKIMMPKQLGSLADERMIEGSVDKSNGAMSARPAMSIAVTVGSHCSAANAATALTRFTVAQRSAMSSR